MITFFVSLGFYVLIAYVTLMYLGFTGEGFGVDKLDLFIGIFWPIMLIFLVMDFFYVLEEKYDFGNKFKNMRFVRFFCVMSRKIIYFLSLPFRPYTIGKIVYRKMINRKYKKEPKKQNVQENPVEKNKGMVQ